MKRFIVLSAVAVSTVFISCKKEEPVTPEPAPIIVNETTPPPPPPAATPAPTPAEQKENKDGTSISINSDGVSLDTKDGKKSTTVKVKDGGAAIEINK